MKSDNLKESRNIEDRRGQSYSQSSGNSNLGGGILQILLSPGSFKSKIIIILLIVFLGGGASLGGLFGNGTSSKFADVRTHLRKVAKMTLSSICKKRFRKISESFF